ncbi:hypothetical protein Tco_0889918, partial [Tanacetum coccineum]
LGAFITKLTIGRMIDGIPYGEIDMVIKDLDLEPKIDAMMRDFLKFLKAKKTKEAKESNEAELKVKKDVVMFNDVKYLLSDAEIRMFKERPITLRAPTASTSIRSRAPTASTRSKAPIASTSTVKAASTAPRGYRKIVMTGCVLALRAPNDPNAPPSLTTRKRKP